MRSARPSLPATSDQAPPLWELEWRIVEIAGEHIHEDRSVITPDAELVADLGLDCLAVVEFLMMVEERFGVTLPDDQVPHAFSERATLRKLAEWVRSCWGTGPSDRSAWKRAGGPVEPVEALPFMQLGGALSRDEWMAGSLYEPIGSNREGLPQYRRRTDGMRCVLLPEAEVWLGSADPAAQPDQRPRHRASLSAFLIDAEPVSNLAFTRFLNSLGSLDPAVLREWCGVDTGDPRDQHFALERMGQGWAPVRGTEQQPMILVSWYGASAYSLWANRSDWCRYQDDGATAPASQYEPMTALSPERAHIRSYLPTEAQWEYAARGLAACNHAAAAEPPGSISEIPPAALARHQRGRKYAVDELPAAPVSERRGLSPFGLHHMAGNVWQWCRDWYDPDFYRSPAADAMDPCNAVPTGVRSERGGSWIGPAALAHPSYRRGRAPSARGRCLGFRCVGSPGDLD